MVRGLRILTFSPLFPLRGTFLPPFNPTVAHLPPTCTYRMDWSNPLVVGSTLGSAAVVYLFIVQSLRWRRYNSIHKKYEAKWKKGELTPAEAQQVMHLSLYYDMPFLLEKALSFALFKTYAIPSISKLLATTKELGASQNVPKRYADTEILIGTWMGCPVSGFRDTVGSRDPDTPAEDPRAALAIARTNYLHSKYNISNDDYLYTMCLFVLEPTTWAQVYGWRPLSELEQDAYYIFWLDIGEKMGITDIPKTLKALKAWSVAYEEEYMVPAESNKAVAGFTIEELLFSVPNSLKSFAERVVICLVEERVRIAMLLPEQPLLLHRLVESLMTCVSLVQGYALLPRRSPRAAIELELPKPDANGDIWMRPTQYRSTPWYKPEGSGISYLFDKFAVRIGFYGDMPSSKYHSHGYRLESVGPKRFENVGQEETFRNAAKIQGCPIGAPWMPAGIAKSTKGL